MSVRVYVRGGLYLLFLAVLSCTYTIDEKYYKPIQPPQQNIELVVDLESPQLKDPYYLDWPANFTLNIAKAGKPLTSFTLLIDNKESSIAAVKNGLLQFPL